MKTYENFKYDKKEIVQDIAWVKKQFSDYKEIRDFFLDVDRHLYGKKSISTETDIGLGFCNDSKSQFTPMFTDIANNLIMNDFKLNLKELDDNYKLPYYESRIHSFRKYMEQYPSKKYYHYKTVKKIFLGDETMTPEDKKQYIRDYFEAHQISQNYDISINSPVSFITVDIIEK